MERAEAEAIYDAGRETCVQFILDLAARVEALEERLSRLEAQARQDSRTSSRPPSQDPSKSRAERRAQARAAAGATGELRGGACAVDEDVTHAEALKQGQPRAGLAKQRAPRVSIWLV